MGVFELCIYTPEEKVMKRDSKEIAEIRKYSKHCECTACNEKKLLLAEIDAGRKKINELEIELAQAQGRVKALESRFRLKQMGVL